MSDEFVPAGTLRVRGGPILFVATGLALAAASVAGAIAGQPARAEVPLATAHADDADRAALLERANQFVELTAFMALPPDAQQRVMAAGLLSAPVYGEIEARLDAEAGETPYEGLEAVVSREVFERMRPVHRKMLAFLYNHAVETGEPFGHVCFAPGTPLEVVQAFEFAVFAGEGGRAQPISRWESSAIPAPSYEQGDPVTLTYSFVRDGTLAPNLDGQMMPSNLFAFLNGIYGSTNTWHQLYHDMFDSWEAVSGLRYVYEEFDDGAPVSSTAPGVLNMRGDLRMAGVPLDGNSNVLAFNRFPPQGGDMVIDTSDNFFSNTSSDSIRMRNVLAHEHGHGQGLAHVCPTSQTKLMEPFISTAFSGPQLDDIISSQTLYGDMLEPNDNLAGAANLGVVEPGTIVRTPLSIDPNNDVDVFSVEVTSPRRLSITVTPMGTLYSEGAQVGSGCTGAAPQPFDARRVFDLSVEVIDVATGEVLGEAFSAGAGDAEFVEVDALFPGEYAVQIRGVREPDAPALAQLYTLSVEVTEMSPAPAAARVTGELPTLIAPGSVAIFYIEARGNDQGLVTDSGMLHYRYDQGAFLTSPLFEFGGENTFVAILPLLECGDEPEFYVSFETLDGQTLLLPEQAEAAPFTATVGVFDSVFADDFEEDLGWVVESMTNDGTWERVVPSAGGNRYDPPTDYDGSGMCYVTENRTGGDLDGGPTILTSPVFATEDGAEISWAYWLHANVGVLEAADYLRVEVATDMAGTNWQTLREYRQTLAAWRTDSVVAGSDFDASATTRVRFVAIDAGSGTIMEAGIDAFNVDGVVCDLGVVCEGDTNGDGVVNFPDLNAVLNDFGVSGQGLPGDVSGDGIINFTDLNIVLNNFGAHCD